MCIGKGRDQELACTVYSANSFAGKFFAMLYNF